MRKQFIWILYMMLPLSWVACQEDPYDFQYTAEAQTETGKRLLEGTDLIAHIESDSSYSLTEGVVTTEFKYLSMEGKAMKAFIFEIDLSTPGLSIEASTPNNKPEFDRQEMTLQATYEDQQGHQVWGGINGDFFNMDTGQPQGILYKDGQAIKTTVTDDVNTFFGISKAGTAMIGDQSTYESVKESLQEAVGGRVTLVTDGAQEIQTDDAIEPRTAIGVSEDGKTVYMLAVDGRNFFYSNGMTYQDLGKMLKALGAYDAINLDGGGSTTFFIRNTPEFSENRFELRNWPSDNGGVERPVANGLLIVSSN